MSTTLERVVGVAEVASPAPRAAWEQLADADPRSLAEGRPAWTDAIVATGRWRDVSRCYRLTDGRRFVLPLVARTGLLGPLGLRSSLPDGWGIGGLVGPDGDAAAVAAVLDDLATDGALLTRIRPDPLAAALWSSNTRPDVVRRPRRAHVLDLDGDLDALRAGLHRSTRRNLAKGERAGLHLTDTATPAHLEAYHRLYRLSLDRWASTTGEPAALARIRGLRRDPLAQLVDRAEALGDRFRLWLAWHDGEPVAGAVALLGNVSHYTRGAMDRDRAGPVRAAFVLQWRMIEDAVAAGCGVHHLGDTGTSASLARFKEGFGARPVPYEDLGLERLPLTRADRRARDLVKKVVGHRDAG